MTDSGRFGHLEIFTCGTRAGYIVKAGVDSQYQQDVFACQVSVTSLWVDPEDSTRFYFSLQMTAGSPAIDFSRIQIVFSTPGTTPVILSPGTVADRSTFTTKESGTTAVTSLSANEQVEHAFKVEPVEANLKMNIEVRPVTGAVTPFSKTAPATLLHTNPGH